MTARRRVGETRAVLAATGVGASLLWGVVAAALLMVVAGVADWAVELPRSLRVGAVPAAALVGLAVAAATLWRARRAFDTGAVALWIEERVPALRYALVTALEQRTAGGVLPELERVVARARWRSPVAYTAGRALALPFALLLAAIAVYSVLPVGIAARIEAPRAGDSLRRPSRGAAAAANRLTPIVATVTPPRYSRRPAVTLEEPTEITALTASGVRLEGRGSPKGVEAALGSTALHVTGGGGRWSVIFAMPGRPAAVRLSDGLHSRVVVLDPQPDSAPVVTLTSPARDSVMREARGSLDVAARASDDIGLAALWLELIVSTGEGGGENFTFRSGVVRRIAVRRSRSASLDGALALDSLQLGPGDVVHLRAVAVDGNTATGPDTGVSETRVLRVARASEYDSVAVEGAPPPDVDASGLSQRMIIQLTEALESRRRKLERSAVVLESRRIGADQARLRKRVGDIIFVRLGESEGGEESGITAPTGAMTPEELLRAASQATSGDAGHALDFEGDESPVVAVNRPLLEAYNTMWSAERELGVGQPGAALPHMRAALAAIMRAREAERVYLRGRPAAVVVDLAKVRLAGNIDSASAAGRSPRDQLARTATRRAGRFDAAMELLRSSPAAAIDSLLLLRVDALGDAQGGAASFAASLAEAVAVLREGANATEALVRARRLVAGAPRVRAVVQEWRGAW